MSDEAGSTVPNNSNSFSSSLCLKEVEFQFFLTGSVFWKPFLNGHLLLLVLT